MLSEVRDQILGAFVTHESVNAVSTRTGIGRDRIYKIWREAFGSDAVQERGNQLRGLASARSGNSAKPEVREQALLAFHTEEPMKKLALRLGVHYTQIRKWWEGEFGIDVVKGRARTLQVARSTENNQVPRMGTRKPGIIQVPCSACGAGLEVSKMVASKSSRILCTDCDVAERGADTPCPVCGFLCVGKKGLGAHLSHSKGDSAHAEWVVQQGVQALGVDGVNHHRCLECGHGAVNLWKHLETVHDLTPLAYVAKWPGAKWRTEASEQKRKELSVEKRTLNGYGAGGRKSVSCPNCTEPVEVSLFAGSLHDFRCDECKAEDELILWQGKTEPQDFVTCRECGHRSEFLVSHIRSAHDLHDYTEKYPSAPLTAIQAGQRTPPNNKLVLSVEQLQPFMDNQGKVIAVDAATAFQCAQWQIRRNCLALGIGTRNRLAWQKSVLDYAAVALRSSYQAEWSTPDIVGETQRPLRFDGYFSARNLLLEAHGDQHFFFTEAWHRTHAEFERQQKVEAFKHQRAKDLGYIVKVVRYTDPIQDPCFWTKLFGDDLSLWVNKSEEAKAQDVEAVLAGLRLASPGFPEIVPSVKTTAEFTKLQGQNIYLDADSFVRPHSSRGTTVCASFFPNRYRARYKKTMSVFEAWNDDDMLRKAIRVQLNAGHPTFPLRVIRALQMICRTPSIFRPAVAKYVYQTYCPSGGTVWDPCAGYGGRLFGAMAAGVGLYIGTDVEPETVAGNQRLAVELGCAANCLLFQERAELFDPKRELDLVFTSPPYFDLEIYGATSREVQSSYGTVQDWLAGFLMVVMQTALKNLRSGGYLILNLPVKPRDGIVLADEAIRIGAKLGFDIQPVIYMPIRQLRASKSMKWEPLLVFRKSL